MIKKRHWAFVGYPESLPTNWVNIIQQTGIPFAISPLHEFDVNPDGEPKKAHFHIILSYDGPVTKNNVNHLVMETLGQPTAIPLESLKGYYRYFTHKDNPEKYQYNSNDIEVFNGFDIDDFETLTKTQIRAYKIELIELIKNNSFKYFSDLIDFLINDLKNYDLVEVAFQFTYMLNTYIYTQNQKQRDKLENH